MSKLFRVLLSVSLLTVFGTVGTAHLTGGITAVLAADCNLFHYGENLDGADLDHCNFSGLYFFNRSFVGANLSYTNLSDTNLTEADLSEANLSHANLTGVVWGFTTCPDYTISDDDGGTCVNNLTIPKSGARSPLSLTATASTQQSDGGWTSLFRVHLRTNSPATVIVLFGPTCSDLVETATQDLTGTPSTQHLITARGDDLNGGSAPVLPGVTYAYDVVVTSGEGQHVLDNGGKCYSITIPKQGEKPTSRS